MILMFASLLVFLVGVMDFSALDRLAPWITILSGSALALIYKIVST